MGKPDDSVTPEETLSAMRDSAGLTAEGARPGGTIDLPALEAQAKKLDDLNSRYPATKEFLEARGVTKVSQLDDQGRADLKAHLEKTLAAALAK